MAKKKRIKQRIDAPIVKMQIVEDASVDFAWSRWLAAGAVVLGIGYLMLNQKTAPQPTSSLTTPSVTTPVTPTNRICLTLSAKAPDSDMSELGTEFNSLQKRGKLYLVRKAEWDDASDRLKSYFNVVECVSWPNNSEKK